MKPGDFFVRSRQFFGFMIPGAMWLSALLLALNYNPVSLVEDGEVIIRAVIFAGVSYQVGFGIQTLIFHILYRHLTSPDALKSLVPKVEAEIKRQVAALGGSWVIDSDRIPVFCKWYVLEHSSEIRTVLWEHEDDINLIVGLPPAVFTLTASILYYAGVWTWPVLGKLLSLVLLALVAVAGLLLWKQLQRFYDSEQRECCEMFLMLQLIGPGEKDDSKA